MKTMKDSGIEWIGKIPENWNIVKYKRLAESRMGETILEKELVEEGVPVYSATQDGEVLGYLKNPKLKINKGSIIIPARGSIGYAHVVTDEVATCTQTTICSTNFKYIISKFLYYCCIGLREKWFEYDGSVVPQITVTQVNNNFVPVPPLSEQNEIVDLLDHKCAVIDMLKTEIHEQIEILKQYKQSLITETVTKGLDPDVEMKDSGVEWIKELPESWNMAKIDALYTLRTEKVSDKDYQPLSVTMQGILPQLETVAKTDDGDNRKLVKKGDFVINSRSDRRGACGISGYDGSVSLINTVLCPTENMNSRYYNWFFHCVMFSDEFYRHGHGIVDDLWTTTWQDMKKIMLPVPTLSEQAKISDFLDCKCAQIDDIIQWRQSQMNAIAQYRKSMIFEYVTGKKDTQTKQDDSKSIEK